MNPLRWLLIPQVCQALQRRYSGARQHDASVIASVLQLLWCTLGWAFYALKRQPGNV